MIYALAMGLGIGATAVVARRIGEKDPEGAARAAAQALVLALIVSVVLGTAGALLAPRLLALMGATPAVIATGRGYATIMLGGEAAIIVLFVVNAIFRGAGDAAIAMRVLWLANIINIILGPLLIFGVGPFPTLGVTGAAVATTIGRSTGAIFAVVRLFRHASRVPVARGGICACDFGVMRQILKLSGSATLQNLIGMASWVGLVRILAGFGSDALAGYTIAVRLIIFALLPSWGLSNAAATMVGQSLGARKPDRAETSVWRAGGYNAVFLTAVGIVFFAGARLILKAFTSDPAVTGLRRQLPSHRRARLPALRVRHGADPVVQRRGRHLDTDLAQSRLLLGVRDPVRLVAGARRRARPVGRVLGDHGVVLVAGGGERVGVPAGEVEGEGGVGCRLRVRTQRGEQWRHQRGRSAANTMKPAVAISSVPASPPSWPSSLPKGSCTFAMAFQIERGKYGSVSLDGLAFILLGLTPEEMGKGNWSVGVIVDERANAEQRDAISAITSGQARRSDGRVGALVGKFLGVESAPIRFDGRVPGGLLPRGSSWIWPRIRRWGSTQMQRSRCFWRTRVIRRRIATRSRMQREATYPLWA